jgi:hypothetical protein
MFQNLKAKGLIDCFDSFDIKTWISMVLAYDFDIHVFSSLGHTGLFHWRILHFVPGHFENLKHHF